MIPDLQGKGDQLRTIPIPALVKVRIDDRLSSAAFTEDHVIRSLDKGEQVIREEISDQKAIWRLVINHARRLRLEPSLA